MRYGSPLGAALGSPDRLITFRDTKVRGGNTSISEVFQAMDGIDGYFGVYANARLIQNVHIDDGVPSDPILIPIDPNTDFTNIEILHLGQNADPFYDISRVARTFEPEQKIESVAAVWDWAAESLGHDLVDTDIVSLTLADGSAYPVIMKWSSIEPMPSKGTWGRLQVECISDGMEQTVNIRRLGLIVATGYSASMPATITLDEVDDSGISGSINLTGFVDESGFYYWRWPAAMEIYYENVNPPTALVATARFNQQDSITYPLNGSGITFGTGTRYLRIRPISDTDVPGTYSSVNNVTQTSPPNPPQSVEVLWASTTQLNNNHFECSEDFSEVQAWNNTGDFSFTDDITDPFGGSRAQQITEANNGVPQTHVLNQVGLTNSAGWVSVYAKMGTGRRYIFLFCSTANVGRVFDLQTGATAGTIVAAPANSTITSIGSGWYRCAIRVASTGGNGQIGFAQGPGNFASLALAANYTGDGSYNYFYGAQYTITASVTILPYFPTRTMNATTDAYVHINAHLDDDDAFLVYRLGTLYRWTHGLPSNLVDSVNTTSLVAGSHADVVLSQTSAPSLSTTYNYVVRLTPEPPDPTGDQEQNTHIAQVEFDASGWVQPRPNTPGLSLVSLDYTGTGGLTIALDAVYDTTDEKGEAITIQFFKRSVGAAYNFSSPDATASLSDALTDLDQLKTASLTFTFAGSGLYYITAKALSTQGAQSEGYAEEILLAPDSDTIAGQANFAVQIGQG